MVRAMSPLGAAVALAVVLACLFAPGQASTRCFESMATPAVSDLSDLGVPATPAKGRSEVEGGKCPYFKESQDDNVIRALATRPGLPDHYIHDILVDVPAQKCSPALAMKKDAAFVKFMQYHDPDFGKRFSILGALRYFFQTINFAGGEAQNIDHMCELFGYTAEKTGLLDNSFNSRNGFRRTTKDGIYFLCFLSVMEMTAAVKGTGGRSFDEFYNELKLSWIETADVGAARKINFPAYAPHMNGAMTSSRGGRSFPVAHPNAKPYSTHNWGTPSPFNVEGRIRGLPEPDVLPGMERAANEFFLWFAGEATISALTAEDPPPASFLQLQGLATKMIEGVDAWNGDGDTAGLCDEFVSEAPAMSAFEGKEYPQDGLCTDCHVLMSAQGARLLCEAVVSRRANQINGAAVNEGGAALISGPVSFVAFLKRNWKASATVVYFPTLAPAVISDELYDTPVPQNNNPENVSEVSYWQDYYGNLKHPMVNVVDALTPNSPFLVKTPVARPPGEIKSVSFNTAVFGTASRMRLGHASDQNVVEATVYQNGCLRLTAGNNAGFLEQQRQTYDECVACLAQKGKVFKPTYGTAYADLPEHKRDQNKCTDKHWGLRSSLNHDGLEDCGRFKPRDLVIDLTVASAGGISRSEPFPSGKVPAEGSQGLNACVVVKHVEGDERVPMEAVDVRTGRKEAVGGVVVCTESDTTLDDVYDAMLSAVNMAARGADQ